MPIIMCQYKCASLLLVAMNIFLYITDPSCILIGNGCFLAETNCTRYEVYNVINPWIMTLLYKRSRLWSVAICNLL